MEGTEAELAKRTAKSPATEQWMEEVCERENCKQALRRVKANKGSPCIDGMTVEELPGLLKEHWPTIREQLRSGTYRPQPVRRAEIPKPDGGVRKLGIPTVLEGVTGVDGKIDSGHTQLILLDAMDGYAVQAFEAPDLGLTFVEAAKA